MGQYTRRGWIKPAMVIFGSQFAFGAQDESKKLKNGAICSESVVRYGAVCGIRNGANCATRVGIDCKERIGNDCYGRIGQNCQERLGPLCNVDRMGHPCAGDDRMGQPCVDSTDNNTN